MMKIRFIINPISGTGKQRNLTEIIKQEIDTNLFQYDIFYTKKSKHATELTKQAVDEKIDIIAAVGGDGTMNECAKTLINSTTALAVIPCGSGNGFAFHFGMNKNLRKSIKQLNQSRFKLVDSCTANQIPFFNISGIGYDAHIANLFSKLNKRGFFNYMKLVLKEFRYPAKEYMLKFNTDKEEKKINAFMISWANTKQFGNNAFISPKSKADDGLIEICILKKFPLKVIPELLIKLFNKRIHYSKYMEIISCKSVTINRLDRSHNLCHIDGEPIKIGSKIEIQVIPKSLKIFIPDAQK